MNTREQAYNGMEAADDALMKVNAMIDVLQDAFTGRNEMEPETAAAYLLVLGEQVAKLTQHFESAHTAVTQILMDIKRPSDAATPQGR